MKIGEYELENPLMNAGDLVKSIEDVRLMANTGVAAVVGGSYTLHGRVGNSPDGEVVYYNDPITHATYNSLGMPNKGISNMASDLNEMIGIAHDLGKPFVLNFAPVTAVPVQEVIDLSELLAKAKVETLDAIELNASCPNVVTEKGGRHELLSHHPELLARVLFELSDIAANEVPFGTLMVRISPFKQRQDANALAAAVHESGTQAVSAFNTFPGEVPLTADGKQILQVPGGAGGKSGPAMTSRAEEQTNWLVEARSAVGADFDIIGSNGVHSGETMKRRLDLGAAAVSATTLFWEAPDWGEAANKVLNDYAELI